MLWKSGNFCDRLARSSIDASWLLNVLLVLWLGLSEASTLKSASCLGMPLIEPHESDTSPEAVAAAAADDIPYGMAAEGDENRRVIMLLR